MIWGNVSLSILCCFLCVFLFSVVHALVCLVGCLSAGGHVMGSHLCRLARPGASSAVTGYVFVC